MNVEKTVLFEDETYKVIRQQNLRGKYRHSVKIDLYAINKSTGRPMDLLDLPKAVRDLVNQAETLI